MVLVIVVAAGLVLCGLGSLRLRRHHRFVAGRQRVVATVTAATERALTLRLPSGESVTVPVGVGLADQWRRQLTHGPGPFEEPDLEDPAGWDEVEASYSPHASPPVILSQTLDAARTMPLILVTLGLLTAVSALLALSIPILLTVLGVATGAVAVVLGASLLRTTRGLGSVALAVTAVLFLGGAGVAMVVAALTWR